MSSQIFYLSLQSNYSLELIYLSYRPASSFFGGVGHFCFVKQI
nr:MAG TPA: hypothetical protein [Caudoviricetes sp.]